MDAYPDILPGSTREFMVWETADPEIWVNWGMSAFESTLEEQGRSPGVIDILSPTERKDYYDAIEWAAVQPWCTGKVGLNGISYYAINQWLVAALQPPHLCAMIPWEGAADFYRDFARHGGIACNVFVEVWYPRQVVSVQHGNPAAHRDVWLNESAAGTENLSPDVLAANRREPLQDILDHPLDDQFHQKRSPDWSEVTVPFLSAANWAGYGLHPRGNFEAFIQAASKQKWLEGHPGRHEEWFYLDQGMALQRRFLDHFLKCEDNGWDSEPPVLLHLRRPFTDEVEMRKETWWPLPSTKWTKTYLSVLDLSLGWNQPTEAKATTFDALGHPVTFLSAPLEMETELTGPSSAKIFISSTTTDADLFLTLQAFFSEEKEVDFKAQSILTHLSRKAGSVPVIANSIWPGASHIALSTATTRSNLVPNQAYELDVEIWPTCVILPAGFRLALQISGKDFERPPSDNPNEAWLSRGSGPWLHTHQKGPTEGDIWGKTTIYTGGEVSSFLTLPIIEPH